jgi:hypothetical protein
MKRVIPFVLVYLLCLSCANEWREKIDQPDPTTVEREPWEWSRDELLAIDEERYDEFSRNTEFQALCDRYRGILDSVASGTTTSTTSLASWHLAMKKFGEEKACKNIATYIIRYERERPATRVDLPEFTVAGVYRLEKLWREMWMMYNMWSSTAYAKGVSLMDIEWDLLGFIESGSFSTFYSEIKGIIYRKIEIEHTYWAEIRTVTQFADFFQWQVGFLNTWDYYSVVEDLYADIYIYFAYEVWRRIPSRYAPLLPQNPPPPPANPAPYAQEIFKNADLSDDDWKKVEDMVKKIMEDCMGGRLYSEMLAKLTDKLTLTKGNTSSDGASFTNEIRLSSLTASDVLLHELFHNYQRYQESNATFDASTLNREVEARLVEYRYVQRLNDEERATTWYGSNTEDYQTLGMRAINSHLNAKGVLRNLESEESALSAVRQYAMLLRDRIPAYRNGAFDYNRDAAENFKNLKELSKDC